MFTLESQDSASQRKKVAKKNSCFSLSNCISEIAVRRCSAKWMFLKVPPNSHEDI